MEIKDCIKIYDNALPTNILSNLIRYANAEQSFGAATVGANNIINKDVRDVGALTLSAHSPSMTNVHWHNFLYNFFCKAILKYDKDLNLFEASCLKIRAINLLKYEKSGHYGWHVDHFYENPRSLSCIFLLNNDYKGGQLCFKNVSDDGVQEIEVKANRVIIWPSNFLFPHKVKPVTEGRRYSVVAWAC